MPSNTNYGLYWDPAGAPSYPAGYEAGIDRYFEDLAHDSGGLMNTDSVLVQYTDGAGEAPAYDSHFGGALTDTDPYPANGCTAAPICLTEATDPHGDHKLRPGARSACGPQARVLRAHSARRRKLPLLRRAVLLGRHRTRRLLRLPRLHPGSGAVIVFANDPYLAGLSCNPGEELPNNNPSDATIAGGLAHEHSESVTDPELSAWYDSKNQEVADKCRTFKEATEFGEPLGKAPDGANYNQVIDGSLYWYQQEWSNEAKGCQQRFLQAPAVSKLAPKSGPAAGGSAVAVTGSHFAAGATVSFGGIPATGVSVTSSTSLTAISPAGAAGTVDVTVTTAAGTSALTKKDHFKYKTK